MNPVASYFKFNPTGAFSVDWYIGKRCNFACSYCVDYLHDNYSPHVPLENMIKLADQIIEKNGENIFWSLTGGEPTVNPDFLKLCKYLHSHKPRFTSLTTNGSRTSAYFKELFQYIDGITLSFHFEHMEKRIDEYIKKCIEIDDWRKEWNKNNNGKKTFILRFMVESGQLKNVEKMENAFRNHGITNIEHRYIRYPTGKPTETSEAVNIVSSKDKEAIFRIKNRENNYYKKDEKSKIKNIYDSKITPDKRKLKFWFLNNEGNYIDKDFHYNELNFDGKNNYENWLCWAGVKHLKITPNGDIYVGSCHVGGRQGNIYDKDSIMLPTEPIRCPKWRCTDNLDLKVPKIKSWNHYHLIKDMIEC